MITKTSRAERIGAFLGHSDGWLVAGILGFFATCVAAWGTSAVVSAKSGMLLMLILDFVAFPIGIVDGIGIWFRLW